MTSVEMASITLSIPSMHKGVNWQKEKAFEVVTKYYSEGQLVKLQAGFVECIHNRWDPRRSLARTFLWLSLFLCSSPTHSYEGTMCTCRTFP